MGAQPVDLQEPGVAAEVGFSCRWVAGRAIASNTGECGSRLGGSLIGRAEDEAADSADRALRGWVGCNVAKQMTRACDSRGIGDKRASGFCQ